MTDKRRKLIFTVGIYLMMFTAAVCTTTQGVFLTHYIDYYHLESFEQGLMSSFQSGGNLIALFLIGVLLGKLKKRSILMISAVLIPAMFFMFGLKPILLIFLLGYFIYGVAFGLLDSLASSMMVDLYADKSSLYMNLLHGIYGLGGLMGPVILIQLDLLGLEWYQILSAMGILAALSSVIYFFSVFISKKLALSSGKDSKVTRNDIIKYFKERKKRTLFICAFLYGAHQIGITVWMTRYISDYLSEPTLGGFTLSVFWVCVAAARLLFPHFKWNSRQAIWVGHLVSGAAIFVGVLSSNAYVMIICVGVAGLAEGMILPLTLDIGCHWEPGHTSLGSSMVLFAHYIGFIITPMLIGTLISVLGVSVGMLLSALLSLIAGFLIYRLKDINTKA